MTDASLAIETHDLVKVFGKNRAVDGVNLASVDEDLTGRENLRLIGRLFGFSGISAKRRADELLEAFSRAPHG